MVAQVVRDLEGPTVHEPDVTASGAEAYADPGAADRGPSFDHGRDSILPSDELKAVSQHALTGCQPQHPPALEWAVSLNLGVDVLPGGGHVVLAIDVVVLIAAARRIALDVEVLAQGQVITVGLELAFLEGDDDNVLAELGSDFAIGQHDDGGGVMGGRPGSIGILGHPSISAEKTAQEFPGPI